MTSDERINISRRTVLAGLGTVGVASAGAGLGTTAVLNDFEGFTNNTFAAGTLDLKLDYKATYDGPNGNEVLGQAPTHQQLIDQDLLDLEEGPMNWVERADLGFACDTEGFVDGDGVPVFSLNDVKPGDSGEVTMSVHICDNPAYLWLRGTVFDDLDNGLTEPESLVDQDGTASGELADNIDVRVWYDENCSNTYDEAIGRSDVLIVQDISGSMQYDQYGGVIPDGSGGTTTKLAVAKDAANSLASTVFGGPGDLEIGVFTFGNENYLGDDWVNGVEFAPSDDPTAVNTAINNIQAVPNGVTGTALGAAVEDGNAFLHANLRSNAEPVMILLTDGEQFESSVDELAAANAAKASGTRIIVIDINAPGDGKPQLLKDMAGSTPTTSGDGDGTDYYNSSADDLTTVLPDIYDSIIQTVLTAEAVLFEGTLTEFHTEMSGGTQLSATPLFANANEGDDFCFTPGTHCLAFEWEVPIEVGNEIQSDSVSFDLDFAAVQCRHNGEGGQNPFSTAS